MLVNASDLASWADRRDAQEFLPAVIRRLVLATVHGPRQAAFRTGEGVQLGGWDGIVSTEEPHPFVPEGMSGWELSTSAQPKGKADDNYTKRTSKTPADERRSAAFVFVTPRRWEGKDAWATERRAADEWRNVMVLDADDLEAWLETAPAVHVWLSAKLGTAPAGAFDLGTAAEEWRNATEPPLPNDFLLAGRATACQQIREWLQQSAKPLAIRSESRGEGVAIIAAAFGGISGAEAEATLARAIVVSEAGAMRRLIASEEPLILIPVFEAGDLVAAATRSGHAVIVPVGEGELTGGQVLDVPLVSRQPAAAALESAGIDREEAYELAGQARRSMTALRRRLALNPALSVPPWAQPSEARGILPAVVAGGWSEAHAADKEAISTLARVTYDEFRDRLTIWTETTDPPMRRRGNVWYRVSTDDSWTLLQRFITREDLDRLTAVALNILGTPDPQYDLTPDRRWMAGALGNTPATSGVLRKGLASTLALIGVRWGDTDPRGTVAASVVRQLLEKANTDWKVWASLSDLLPDLAEAAPDAFLSAVKEGLRGEAPVLPQLFNDSGTDPMFSSSPHTGLLWALERLAWSPDYLGQVVSVLATLDRLDPGGRISNRPAATLASIFRPWLPQTAASPQQRLRVLDKLREQEPEPAWALMKSMLPEFRGVGTYTARPIWREWAPDSSVPATRSDRSLVVREIVGRMLADVGFSGQRWAGLIDALPMLGPHEHTAVVAALQEINLQGLSASERATIWDQLRKLVADHRSFAGADWAMAPDTVTRVDDLRSRFEPSDSVARYGWLFDGTPRLPDASPVLESDWSTQEAAVEAKRIEAIEQLMRSCGLDGVLALTDGTEEPEAVGRTLAKVVASPSMEDDILDQHLPDAREKRRRFGRGFAQGRYRTQGAEWVSAKLEGIAAKWVPRDRAELLDLLDATPGTWHLARELGPEVEHEYWLKVWPRQIATEHAEEAARQLLRVGRPNAALDALAVRKRGEVSNSDLVIQILEQVLTSDSAVDHVPSSFGYHLAGVLDSLADRSDVDERKLALIEWRLLPILDRHDRAPKSLHRLLASDPSFFVEVLSFVYRGKEEEASELSREDSALAERGWHLLNSWRSIPGTRADRHVDLAALRAWVHQAREQLARAGRSEIGDQIIGQVLSGSPSDEDGSFPCIQVRSVIEEVESGELEEGFVIGEFNSRDAVIRSLTSGGGAERQLAERYEGLATAVADQWPRSASMLRRIAASYRTEATREDLEAALREDLDG